MSLLLFSQVFAQDPGGGQSFPGAMNPSMSFNGLFLGGVEWDDGKLADPHNGDEVGEAAFPDAGETYGTGLAVQEMELQILSNVDPYFKANVVLSLPGLEGIEIEEGYVQLVSVPHVIFTVGKVKEAFGRENQTHTHALLTIDKSLIGQRIFGGEGLDDVGVNAAVLLPVPWYSELTLSVDRGTNELALGSGDPLGFGYLGHWKNMFDLSDDTSVELGVSGLTGLDSAGQYGETAGVDLTLKSHGRARHQFNRLVWQNEYLWSHKPGVTEDETLGGLYSTLEYSFSKLVWIGGRFDAVGFPSVDDAHTFGAIGILVLAPTEFSAVRLQGQRQFLPQGHTVDSVAAQLNFTLGVHPAHSY